MKRKILLGGGIALVTVIWFSIMQVMIVPYGPLAQAQSVKPEQRNTFRCHTLVSTATTLTELTGCAVEAGTSYYVTDVIFASSVISATAADSQLTLKYGTGTACATGTVVFWVASNLAHTTVTSHLQTPIRIPKGNAICWIDSPAGTKSVTVLGYKES